MGKMKIPVIEDQPKLFKNKAAIEARHKRLQEPHVKPLSDYIVPERKPRIFVFAANNFSRKCLSQKKIC